MKEGFIISNKVRKVVFAAIASGEKRIEITAKREHLALPQAERALKELVEKDFIEAVEGELNLTGEGEKAYQMLKKERLI